MEKVRRIVIYYKYCVSRRKLQESVYKNTGRIYINLSRAAARTGYLNKKE